MSAAMATGHGPEVTGVQNEEKRGGHSAPCKGADLQRVQFPPGNWIAPAGSNRSDGGGNEAVKAFDGKDRLAVPRARRLQHQ